MCKSFCMYENRYCTQNNLDLIAVSCCPQNRGLWRICQFLTYRNVKQQDQQRQHSLTSTHTVLSWHLPILTTHLLILLLHLMHSASFSACEQYYEQEKSFQIYTLENLESFPTTSPSSKILKMKIKLLFICCCCCCCYYFSICYRNGKYKIFFSFTREQTELKNILKLVFQCSLVWNIKG